MRVCMVGAGYYAPFHLSAWRRIPGIEVVAIADIDISKAHHAVREQLSIAIFNNVDEMVRTCKPDAIDIVTPEATHLPLIRELAGKVACIICQKPLAPTLEEAMVMMELAEQGGTTLFVHENFRFQPWFMEARSLIDQDRIGVPQQLTFRFRPGDGRGSDAYLERQPYFRTMPRFLVHETVIHYTDTFRYLLGEVSAVTARLRRVNPSILGEDAGIVIYEFNSGAVAILDANRDLEHEATQARYTQGTMLLEGYKATLRLDGEARIWLRGRGDPVEQLTTTFARTSPNGDSVFNYQSAVATAMHNDASTLKIKRTGDAVRYSTVADSLASAYLRNLQIEKAIYLSAAEGRTIKV